MGVSVPVCNYSFLSYRWLHHFSTKNYAASILSNCYYGFSMGRYVDHISSHVNNANVSKEFQNSHAPAFTSFVQQMFSFGQRNLLNMLYTLNVHFLQLDLLFFSFYRNKTINKTIRVILFQVQYLFLEQYRVILLVVSSPNI